MADRLIVAHRRDLPADVVVLGTDNIQDALRAAGLDPRTQQWDGSYADRAGWVLHRDGTASMKFNAGGSNAKGRPAVLFTAVTERKVPRG